MFTRYFLKQVAERAIKTFSQTAAGLLVADAFVPLEVASWESVGVASGMAALVSVLTSIASAKVGDPTSASVVTEVIEDYSDPDFVPDYDPRDRGLRH